MSIKKTIARNVIWNWAGMAVNMFVGFVVLPFLVLHLGETTYGLWIVIASLSSYFGMLDLGVRGAVGRNIALDRARGDQDGVNATLSTALAILCVVGTIAFGAILVVSLVFFRFIEVPVELIPSVRAALILVGLTLALNLPLSAFDSTLWASQRFDLLNAIDIPATLVRAGLTFLLISRGHGLLALALINLVTLVGAQATKGVASFCVDPGLRLGPYHIERQAARHIFGFSSWYFLLSLARLATVQLSPVLVGARMGWSLVTPFSIAARLLGYANALLVAGSGVLMPLATALHAAESRDRQQRLFLSGGRICTDFALLSLGGFLLLGDDLIHLWMRRSLSGLSQHLVWRLLAILAVGEFLPMTQSVSGFIVLGMGRHKVLACLCLLEAICSFSLAAAVAPSYSLVGVCASFALWGALCRGLGPLVYACRVVGVPVRQYLLRVMLPSLATAGPPTLGLVALIGWRAPTTWSLFIMDTGLYGLSFAGLSLLSLRGTLWATAADLPRSVMLSPTPEAAVSE